MFTNTKIVLLGFGLAANSYALISWDNTQITQKADPMAESVSATFKFTNIGDHPVEIKDVKPSCGCTTAKLDKKTYAPGESGEITATLNIGNRQGLQSKSITVTTDDDEQPTILMMKTLIPEVVSIQPAFVFWQQGDVPDIKTINIKVGLDEPIHVVKVESDTSTVGVQLEEVQAGKHYRINLYPTSTDELAKARITIKTDYPKDKPKTFYVYAHVK